MRKCRAVEVPFSDCSSNAQKKWSVCLKPISFTSHNYKTIRFRTLQSNKIGFGMRVQPVGKANGQQSIDEKNCFWNAGCAPPFCCPCVSEKLFVVRVQTRLQSHYKRLVVSVQALCSVSTKCSTSYGGFAQCQYKHFVVSVQGGLCRCYIVKQNWICKAIGAS